MNIDQFMWGFQPHFRHSLEDTANSLLGSIGVVAAPTALLIGFAENPARHPVCVEPEDFFVSSEHFSMCTEEATAAYEAHESRNVINTHAGLHERFHADLRDSCRSEAIAAVLNSSAAGEVRHWFVGRSARVANYHVYPVIGVLRSTWDPLPTLVLREQDHRVKMYLSFQEAVVHELLASSRFALSISDQPESLLRRERTELTRRAFNTFVSHLVFFKGNFMGGELDSAMNLVAAQPYEGRTGVGNMLMAAESEYSLALKFDRPIGLSRTRSLRKALEMTDHRLQLVTDGKDALGLGTLNPDYDPARESAFTLRVIGRGSWELQHAGIPLVAVTDGHAEVPRPRLARPAFNDTIERLFGAECEPGHLWKLAVAASNQAHGTMLVVHSEARAEAVRLAPPAMSVTPAFLEDSTLLAASAIDGAIIVDPMGHCHAVGAILDGRASPGLGDASRGARFNSAHRYLADSEAACLIIIVSEDGMINLIPDLPRRVKASYVEDVISEVETLSNELPVRFETFHKRAEHLRSLESYLTPEQCDRGNAARERVEQFRESSFKSENGLGGILRIGYDLLKPNANLDETYFLPENE